jgi:hypothetical protein
MLNRNRRRRRRFPLAVETFKVLKREGTMRMKIASALAVVTGFAAVGLAAPAHADESMYLQEMREPNKLFVQITDSQLLRLGYLACEVMRSKIADGLPMSGARSFSDKAVASAMNSMGVDVDRASYMHITQDAEDFLC